MDPAQESAAAARPPSTPSSAFVLPLSPLPTTSSLPPEQNSNSPTILVDYISRLSRWAPRLTRYAQSLSQEVGSEPVNAFSPTRHGSGVNTPKEKGAGSRTLSAAFSLPDVERLLSSSWWNMGRKETDSDGLDVDMSGLSIFGAQPTQPHSQEQTPLQPLTSSSDPSSSQPLPPQDKGNGLFLSYYSPQDLISIFSSTGVLSALSSKGFSHPSLLFDTSDPYQHRLSLVDTSLFSPTLAPALAASERFLVDLYMKRRDTYTLSSLVSYQLMQRLLLAKSWEGLREMTGEIRAPYVGLEGAREVSEMMRVEVEKAGKQSKGGKGAWDVTEIAWMQMHNPLAPITRPLLPGQRFPGLGLGREIASVMEAMALRSSKTDALINFPFHWHNAVTYFERGYRHLDPIYEAYVQWMTLQLGGVIKEHGFCFVAWAISMGHLRRETYLISFPPLPLPSSSPAPPSTSSPNPSTSLLPAASTKTKLSSRLERWSPSEQVYPTSESMKSYFSSAAYRSLFGKYEAIFRKDGGANEIGVGVIDSIKEGGERKADLIVDMENCPELWKYSFNERWRNRDPETGEFR